MRYWTGLAEPGFRLVPAFTLVVSHPGALRSMLLPPSELHLAEAFVRGDLDVEGDLEAATALAPGLRARLRDPRRLARLLWHLQALPRGTARKADGPPRGVRRRAGRIHSRARDAAVLRDHYDVGNAFYELWLDQQYVYSCAYFDTEADDLEAAQQAKLDLICRKLRLRPGDRFLDIGCGWGALVRHAARHYGVTALGVTLSPAQVELARGRIAADGLGARCRVDLCDYRDLVGAGRFDRIASVGMVEHVGARALRRYFATVYDLLAPGGLFLSHGIISLDAARTAPLAHRIEARLWRQGRFMDRYVFPDGELAPLARLIEAAEGAGFETRDVESFREHYVRTLRHWVGRLEARRAEAVRVVGDSTYRIWRLYMAASAHAFATGRIGVIQHLLARTTANGAVPCPLRRDLV